MVTSVGSPKQLAHVIAIRELTARYNDAFENGDADAWTATFVPEGIFGIAGGPTFEGEKALRSLIAESPAGILHLTTDAVVELDGERATQRCRVITAGPVADTGELILSGLGRYVDELQRTADGWRFVRRTATMSRVRGGAE